MKVTILSTFVIAAGFLAGCGGEKKVIDSSQLQERDGLAYQLNEAKPYTGHVVEYYPQSQQKRYLSVYKNGQESGLWTAWHRNGQKAAEVRYKNGKREGVYIEWHENGVKAVELRYRNGNVVYPVGAAYN